VKKTIIKSLLLSSLLLKLSSPAHASDTFKEESEALKRAMLPVQSQVQLALKANVKLQKSFDSYLQQGKAILGDQKLLVEEKSRRIKKLNLKQLPQLAILFKESKIDRMSIEKKVNDVFQRLQAKYKKSYKWRLDEGLAVHWNTQQNETQDPAPTPPGPITQILQAPFDNRDTSAVGEERFVDLDEGKYSTFADIRFFGNNTDRNGIGHFFQPSSAYNRIKVTASVSNAEVHLFAIGYIGASSSTAHSSVRIHKDGEVICEKKFNHGSVFAVIGWISEDNHGDQFTISCKIRNTSSSEELNTTLTTKSEASSTASIGAFAAVDTTIRKLEIKMFNE